MREDVLDHDRREAERGLVEHDEARLPHQAAGDRQHLLLAARQRAGELPAPLGEAREQGEHARRALARAPARARGMTAPISRFSTTVILGKI